MIPDNFATAVYHDRHTKYCAMPENQSVRIIADTDPESPRDWDDLGTMVYWHSRYILGDESPSLPPDEWYAENEKDFAVILPLYVYEHSGITMSTGGFSCPWDSGQVGYIYITKDKAISEYGPDYDVGKLESYLKSEVQTFDYYLTGQVYGYEIIDPDGECVDSCWGFLGPVESSGMLEYIPKELHAAALAADIEYP